MAFHLKGFEMAFEGGKAELRNKYDLIVFSAHYALVQEDFLAVGVGDEVSYLLFKVQYSKFSSSVCQFTPDDEKKQGSEMLPAGWKADGGGVYSLKYRSRDGRLKLLFKGIHAGDHFIISAVVSQCDNKWLKPLPNTFFLTTSSPSTPRKRCTR